MSNRYRSLVALMAVLIFGCLAMSASAQSETLGALVAGQPAVTQFAPDAPAPRYSYALAQPSIVTIQAFSETAQPAIAVLQNGVQVAAAPSVGAPLASLTTFLSAGDYVVEVSAGSAATGALFLIVESETPVAVSNLPLGSVSSGEVTPQTTVALYRFTALGEPSYVYAQHAQNGVAVRLINTTTGLTSAVLSGDLLGGRLDIPAGSASYHIEVEHSGSLAAEAFTLCWATVAASACGNVAPLPPVATEEVIPASSSPCVVTPVAAAVNVRASASTSAPIIGSLAGGTSATVLGIAPDRSFYNVQVGGVNGWVSASVVVASGDCANIPVVTPPQFQALPTQAPTQPPAQPTQPPAQPPSEPTQPPPPPPPPTETPSGPCVLRVNSQVRIYTQPIEQADFILDAVDGGGELIPTGRLAGGGWWRTNYGGAWVPTHYFGGAITVSGDCSNLPTLS